MGHVSAEGLVGIVGLMALVAYCGDGSHGTGYVFRGYPLGQSFFFRLKRISEALIR